MFISLTRPPGQSPKPGQSAADISPPPLTSELSSPSLWCLCVKYLKWFHFPAGPNWYTVFPRLFLSSKTSVIQIKLPSPDTCCRSMCVHLETHSGVAHPEGTPNASCADNVEPWGEVGNMCLMDPVVTASVVNGSGSYNSHHFFRQPGGAWCSSKAPGMYFLS